MENPGAVAYTLLTLKGVISAHLGVHWRTLEHCRPLGLSASQTLVFQRFKLAEGVGFEPTVGCPTSVFKTDAIDHSATPPSVTCAGGYGGGVSGIQAKPLAGMKTLLATGFVPC
jgi:hypothetical protein